MSFTLYAVDNELAALNTIENYMKNVPYIIYKGGELDSHKAKEFLLGETVPNIVLLDIQTGGVDGRELAQLLQGRALVIFTTGYSEFALESYEYGAVDYLLKPYTLERFMKAIEKAKERLLTPTPYAIETNKHILLKDSRTGKTNNIPLDKITHAHSNGNYSNIYVEGSPYMLSLLSLGKVWELLGMEHFIRVEKQWLINFDQIKNYDSEFIKLKDGTEIKIGRTYKQNFREQMRFKKKSK